MPDQQGSIRLETIFHLITQPPKKKGGVVLVLAHGCHDFASLLRDNFRVAVGEAVALMLNPEASTNGQPSGLGGV